MNSTNGWLETWTKFTRPETNSSHLKMDGWNTSFLLEWPIFRVYVSFREFKLNFLLTMKTNDRKFQFTKGQPLAVFFLGKVV